MSESKTIMQIFADHAFHAAVNIYFEGPQMLIGGIVSLLVSPLYWVILTQIRNVFETGEGTYADAVTLHVAFYWGSFGVFACLVFFSLFIHAMSKEREMHVLLYALALVALMAVYVAIGPYQLILPLAEYADGVLSNPGAISGWIFCWAAIYAIGALVSTVVVVYGQNDRFKTGHLSLGYLQILFFLSSAASYASIAFLFVASFNEPSFPTISIAIVFGVMTLLALFFGFCNLVMGSKDSEIPVMSILFPSIYYATVFILIFIVLLFICLYVDGHVEKHVILNILEMARVVHVSQSLLLVALGIAWVAKK